MPLSGGSISGSVFLSSLADVLRDPLGMVALEGTELEKATGLRIPQKGFGVFKIFPLHLAMSECFTIDHGME